ncbi:MAG: S1 RNA-binding domain-containing protein, partial [Deltaproteobacteria bacterium]|nr:S1 RNA-binding domain-containing protein [Deltaproteobacteria bacterium]
EGEIVAGRIIAIDKDYVLVDIGYNSEGQIRIQEFKDDQGNITASQGDNVEVMVEYWDEVEECIILSKEKATKVKIREDIKNSLKDSALDYLFNKDVKVAKCPKCGLMAVIRGHKEIKISEETAYKIFTIRYCYKCNWRKEEEESYRDDFSDIQGPPRYEDEQERLRDIYGEGGFETEDGHFFPESWDPS